MSLQIPVWALITLVAVISAVVSAVCAYRVTQVKVQAASMPASLAAEMTETKLIAETVAAKLLAHIRSHSAADQAKRKTREVIEVPDELVEGLEDGAVGVSTRGGSPTTIPAHLQNVPPHKWPPEYYKMAQAQVAKVIAGDNNGGGLH